MASLWRRFVTWWNRHRIDGKSVDFVVLDEPTEERD